MSAPHLQHPRRQGSFVKQMNARVDHIVRAHDSREEIVKSRKMFHSATAASKATNSMSAPNSLQVVLLDVSDEPTICNQHRCPGCTCGIVHRRYLATIKPCYP